MDAQRIRARAVSVSSTSRFDGASGLVEISEDKCSFRNSFRRPCRSLRRWKERPVSYHHHHTHPSVEAETCHRTGTLSETETLRELPQTPGRVKIRCPGRLGLAMPPTWWWPSRSAASFCAVGCSSPVVAPLGHAQRKRKKCRKSVVTPCGLRTYH